MKTFLYKFFKSVLPCAFITLSVGFCYAFSLFAPEVASALGTSKNAVQFAFCLNIFFLGMGAAFFGPLVEKRIKAAAVVSTCLLFAGLCCSGLAIRACNIWLFYLGMGVLCGISEGCGYVVPVKNLLLWWNKTKKKALISAISIISFGLGSTVCSYLFRFICPKCGIEQTFYIFACVYLISMTIGCILINKPKYARLKLRKQPNQKRFLTYLSDSFFRRAWLFMFLNISMGLILIGSCAAILKDIGVTQNAVIVIMMLCGIFNGAGRLVFPLISDFMSNRLNIWAFVLILEIIVMMIPAVFYIVIPFSIILINATYGSAFATLPAVLADRYGTKELSVVHGYCLSAWGMASVFAYFCTAFVIGIYGNYYALTFILAAVYAVNFINVLKLKNKES